MTGPKDVLGGSLGFFWSDPARLSADDDSEVWRGYIRQLGNDVDVELLIEEVGPGDLFGSSVTVPTMLIGVCTSTSVLIPRFDTVQHNMTLGPRASVVRLRARHVVTDLDEPWRVRDGTIKRASLRFRGLLAWAGLRAEQVQVTRGPDSRLRSATFTLDSASSAPSARLGRGRTLHLTTHWHTAGRHEQRTSETALDVACSCASPASLADVVSVFESVQAILMLAYNGWIPAAPGRVRLTGRSGAPVDGDLWDGRLMTSRPGLHEADLNHFPFFTLADLGGTAGLARWVVLCEEHPRATGPVARLYTSPGRTADEVLVSLCQAAEYWVSTNASGWAGRRVKGSDNLRRLVDRFGSANWKKVVGDVDRWCIAVWKAHTDLKHDPSKALPADKAQAFALSIRVLLQCALLNEAAKTQKIAARFSRDYRLRDLAKRLAPHL